MTATMASRRDFLKLTTAGVASNALGVTTSRYANIMGANDRVRVAICGVRGRGNDHIRGFSRAPAAEIAALCDVDESVSNRRLGDIEKGDEEATRLLRGSYRVPYVVPEEI
jgi:hypothetical protein